MTGPAVAAGLQLAAALDCAARGWHVVPLWPGGKRPAFPGHERERCTGSDARCRAAGRHVGWQDRATTDPGRITRAWSQPPRGGVPYGIGIACGPSGLVVVDLDVPKPGQAPPPQWAGIPGVIDGGDVLAVLAQRAGQPFPYGDTYTVTTGSGGTHLYYQAPPPGAGQPLRNTTRALGWLIDTRAAGGQVVAPPTTITGRDGTPGTYRVAVDAPVAPLPAWLATALAPRPLPAPRAVSVALRACGGAYLTTAVTDQLTTITTAEQGTRNSALFHSAIALGQLVAGGALTRDDVTGWLETAAHTAGLGAAETAKTIASGLARGATRPRTPKPARAGTAARVAA